jgi:hypothetical protein
VPEALVSVTGAEKPCQIAVDAAAAVDRSRTVLLHKRTASFSKRSLHNSEEASLLWKAKHVCVCKENFLLKLALFMIQVRQAGIIIYFPTLGKNLAWSCYENKKQFVLLIENISSLRRNFPLNSSILYSRIPQKIEF